MVDYYSRDGSPMTVTEWAARYEDAESKRVALTKVGDVEVSTVWLGLNHNYGEGPPLIFETIVFGGHDEVCERYATEEEALAGHARVVAELEERQS